MLFNFVFLLSDVTWVLRTEIHFLKHIKMQVYPVTQEKEEEDNLKQSFSLFLTSHSFTQERYTMEEMYDFNAAAGRVSLESEKYTSKMILRDTVCHICLSEIESGEHMIRLACTHYFHSECIRDWMKIQTTCPSCRDQV